MTINFIYTHDLETMYMYVLHETCVTKTCAIRTRWCI